MRVAGKFRGKVVNATDPDRRGRLKVRVPGALGTEAEVWAMPCVPYAGPGVGMYFLPPVGANVWVEFEGGDPGLPIWMGCFWGEGEACVGEQDGGAMVLKTRALSLIIREDEGGSDDRLVCEVGPPIASARVTVRVDRNGVRLTCGSASVRLDGTTVSVNEGALEVT